MNNWILLYSDVSINKHDRILKNKIFETMAYLSSIYSVGDVPKVVKTKIQACPAPDQFISAHNPQY